MIALAIVLVAAALNDLQSALASNDLQQVHIIEDRLLHGDATSDTLLTAGAMLARHDLLDEAAEMFESCTKRYPESFEAKYNLALARIGLRQYAEATAALNTITAKTPAVEYLRGKILFATGHLPEARQSLVSAFRSNPGQENYALDLALLYIRSSAYLPAIEVLQKALERHPESEELTLELALSEALTGRSEEAIAICRKLLDQPPARLIASFAECFQQNYVACETESAVGLSAPHPNPYLYYLHAEALWNLNSGPRAKIAADLDQAIEKIPSCSVCLLLRSRISDKQRAIEDLRTALAVDPKLAAAWYRLSMLYRDTGQTSEAAEALRRYRALRDSLQNSEIESFRSQFLR